jgi:iron complex transport system substrate-binding protein
VASSPSESRHETAVAVRPRRIVALAPSAAEILFALDAAPRVVGVSDFARDLPEAKGKPTLGGFVPDLERIAALRPDLIVVSRDGTDRAAAERLVKLGFRVVVTDGNSLDGVLADLRRVGTALGENDEASRVILGLKARIEAVERRVLLRGGAPRSALAVIWPDPPVVASPKTFIGDVMTRAGLRNVVGAEGEEWPRVSYETLASWNPSLIIRPDTVENRAAFEQAFLTDLRWRVVPAAREGRIVSLPGDWLERPGPRLVDALEKLVEILGR